uniref:LRRCT domain-containing protein n=1 Tax=Macrostomum lignano TaxID=282301 RepID=A0A1I8IXN9_9PLAT
LITAASFVTGSLTACGYCMCERSSVSCDFGSVHDRIKPGFALSDFIPNADCLKRVGVDPSNFEDLYVNCKNSRALGHAEPVLPAQVYHHRSVRPNQNRAGRIRGLYILEKFDASDNNLELLPPALFGQRTLSILKLSENPRLRLDPRVFRGLTLERLVLSRCQLTEFPLGALFPIRGLRELTLSENEIQLVPREAQVLIANLTILYLDGNPIECTCANRWLRESVDWAKLSPSVSRISKLPTCKSPFSLMDIELTKVEPSKFLCPPPRISGVDLRVSSDSALLECSADGEASQSLAVQRIAWSYRNLAISEITLPAPNGPRFVKMLRRRPGSLKDQLIVYASAIDGHSASINVSLRWPTNPAATTRMTPARLPADDDDKNPSVALIPEPVDDKTRPVDRHGLNQSDYYTAKQFTLLEMIVAVIGTFLTTSLAFLLCCQFARWYRRRDRKRWLPASAGYAGATTYGYSLHHPHQTGSLSQHEYDVPPSVASAATAPPPHQQQPPTLPLKLPSSASVVNGGGGGIVVATAANSNEFLDFSNPRLKYNV